MKKAGRSADTTFCFFQAQEQHFEVVQQQPKANFENLYNYIIFYS